MTFRKNFLYIEWEENILKLNKVVFNNGIWESRVEVGVLNLDVLRDLVGGGKWLRNGGDCDKREYVSFF